MLRKLTSLLVLQTFLYSLHAQEGLIIQSPMSMVAALGTNVTFTCRVIGSILWSINGIQVFPNGVEDFVLSGIFVPAAQLNISSVRILAGPFNNGTTLSCLVEKFPGILNESELVNFTSYGSPSVPSDLIVTLVIAERGFMLAWSPGFAQQGEDVTFVLTLDSGEQTVSMTEVNTTSTFLATPSDGRECLLYRFSLRAKNDFNLSAAQLTGERLAPTAPNVVATSDISISISLLNAQATTNITFQDLSPCSEFSVDHYNLTLSEVASSYNDTLGSTFTMLTFLASAVSSGGMVVLKLVGATLKTDRAYAATLSAINNVSSSLSNFTLYTTGLQRCLVVMDTSTLSATITCFFAADSSAMGCQAFFMNNLLANLTLDPGAVVAMAIVQLPEGSMVDEILVSEVLVDRTVGNIALPAIITMVTSPTTTAIPTSAVSSTMSSTGPFETTTAGRISNIGFIERNMLYIIVGGIGGVIFILLLVIIIVFCVIRINWKSNSTRSSHSMASSEELKPNYVYGTGGVSSLFTGNDFLMENGLPVRNNTYDAPGLNGATADLSGIPPTYETVQVAMKGMLIAGGPAVLNPVYGSANVCASPTPTSKEAPNPIYSETLTPNINSVPPYKLDFAQEKHLFPMVSGMNPVYADVGPGKQGPPSLSQPTHYANALTTAGQPPDTVPLISPSLSGVDMLTASRASAAGSLPMPPMYEELHEVPPPLAPVKKVPVLSSNESYGVLNIEHETTPTFLQTNTPSGCQ